MLLLPNRTVVNWFKCYEVNLKRKLFGFISPAFNRRAKSKNMLIYAKTSLNNYNTYSMYAIYMEMSILYMKEP